MTRHESESGGPLKAKAGLSAHTTGGASILLLLLLLLFILFVFAFHSLPRLRLGMLMILVSGDCSRVRKRPTSSTVPWTAPTP